MLNGQSIGAVEMGAASDGGDYRMEIPDSVLTNVMPSIVAAGRVNISFALATDADSFRLAVEEDFLDSSYNHYEYGVDIGFGLVQVPEPSVTVLMAVVLPCLLRRRRRPARTTD